MKNLWWSLMLTPFIAVSCGGGYGNDDDDDSGPQEEEDTPTGQTKNLFSVWSSSEDQLSLDFRGMTFNRASNFNFVQLGTGLSCSCIVAVSGTQSTGAIAVGSCSGQLNCTEFENNGVPYTYSKSGSVLQICSAPNSCSTYR